MWLSVIATKGSLYGFFTHSVKIYPSSPSYKLYILKSQTMIDFFLTSGKEGRYQVILKKVNLPVVPRNTCLEALRKTRLGPYFKLHESFICAGGEQGKDTCKVMISCISCQCLYHSYVTIQGFLLKVILNLY